MLSRKKDLIGLLVKTRSGREVGVVADFEIDVEQHTIVGYYVKKSKVLPEFIAGELVVRPKQVVSITKAAMLVDDLVVPEKNTATAQAVIEGV